jgi:hypothetical protein
MNFSLRKFQRFSMVVISLLISVLLATTAFADPSAATLAHTRRKAQFFQNAQDNIIATDGAPRVLYGPNWAGSGWNKSEPVRKGNEWIVNGL